MDDEYDLMAEFDELGKKYSLPSYDSLAEEFDIEKVSEKESSFLLREVRKTITEKTYSYLHLLENFLNPNPHPMFLFSLLKNVTPELKQDISEVYKELSKLQMKAIRLDLIYSEEKESAFIKESHKAWQDIKIKLDKILSLLDTKTKEEPQQTKADYFG